MRSAKKENMPENNFYIFDFLLHLLGVAFGLSPFEHLPLLLLLLHLLPALVIVSRCSLARILFVD